MHLSSFISGVSHDFRCVSRFTLLKQWGGSVILCLLTDNLSKIAFFCLFPGIHVIEFYVFIYLFLLFLAACLHYSAADVPVFSLYSWCSNLHCGWHIFIFIGCLILSTGLLLICIVIFWDFFLPVVHCSHRFILTKQSSWAFK